MKAFGELTALGQARRIRELAQDALTNYDLDVENVTLLNHHENTFFEVRTPGTERFALRVGGVYRRRPEEVIAEAHILRAVHEKDPGFMPLVVKTKDGAEYTIVEHFEGVPGPRVLTLFSWLEGRHLGVEPSSDMLTRLGAALAHFHNLSQGITVPEGAWLKKMNKVWPLGFPEKIYFGSNDPLLPLGRCKRFKKVAERLEDYLGGRFAERDSIRVLHGDFRTDNVKVESETVRILDLDDCQLGFPEQDIAIALFHLGWIEEEESEYESAQEHFLEGYSSVRPLPFTDLEDLQPFLYQVMLAETGHYLVSDDPADRAHWASFVVLADRKLKQWLV